MSNYIFTWKGFGDTAITGANRGGCQRTSCKSLPLKSELAWPMPGRFPEVSSFGESPSGSRVNKPFFPKYPHAKRSPAATPPVPSSRGRVPPGRAGSDTPRSCTAPTSEGEGSEGKGPGSSSCLPPERCPRRDRALRPQPPPPREDAAGYRRP